MDRADWDHRYDSATLVWGAGPNALVAELLTPLAPGRALDLASGEGRHTLWLAARGWRATGIEQSGVAVRRARELAAAHQPPLTGRATFEEADLVDWRPGPGTADLVLIAFLHLPAHERRRVLRSAWSALAPGSHLLVVGHDSRNLDEGAGGPDDPALLYTAGDLLADLGLGGAGPADQSGRATVLCAGEHERPAASGDRAIDAVLFARREG